MIFKHHIWFIRRYDLGIFAWDSLTPAQRERRRNLIAQFRRSSPPPLFSNQTCNSVIFLDGRSGREKTFPSLWQRGCGGRWVTRWRIVFISTSTSFEFFSTSLAGRVKEQKEAGRGPTPKMKERPNIPKQENKKTQGSKLQGCLPFIRTSFQSSQNILCTNNTFHFTEEKPPPVYIHTCNSPTTTCSHSSKNFWMSRYFKRSPCSRRLF